MKKTFFATAVIMFMFASLAVLPSSVLAFWPFDGGGGQVMGAQTSTVGGFFGLLQRFFGHAPMPATASTEMNESGASGVTGDRFPVWGPSGATGSMGAGTSLMCNFQTRLNAAVTAGKITQAQETEIASQMSAICAEQQKIAAMQTALYQWFKTNNISTAIFSEPPHPMPFIHSSTTGATGVTSTSNNRMPSQGHGDGNTSGGHPPQTGGGDDR